MSVNFIRLTLLAITFTLGWNSYALAEVKLSYDRFKGKTTITVLGQRVQGRPILRAWHESDGQKPDPKQSIEVGFLVDRACGHPNFLADGKRVQVEPGSASPTNLHLTLNEFDRETQNIEGFFTFSFFNLPEIKQITDAKVVEYQLCARTFILSPQDRTELRKFLSYFRK